MKLTEYLPFFNQRLRAAAQKTSRSRMCLWLIVLVTIISFSPSLNNSFVHWDEDELLLENPFVREVSIENIKKIFTTPVVGRYYPLSILSYQIDYKMFQFQPVIYHFNDLILHLLNVILVFYILQLLGFNLTLSAGTVLLFGIHPLQVESVAWAASRKDVLAAFFFFTALISYMFVYRKKDRQRSFYVLSSTFFVFSLFAKPAAITFPVILLLVDVFLKRKITLKDVINKMPLLFIALFFSFLTIRVADSIGGFPGTRYFSFTTKILFSLYAFFLYVSKLFFPYQLSCLYPFPERNNGVYSGVFYISILAVLGLIYAVVKKGNRPLKMAFLFFCITIFPVLHLIRVNTSVIYERFAYIPSLGIFLMMSAGYHHLLYSRFKTNPFMRRILYGLAVIYIVFLSSLTWQRCHVWQDYETLWSDVIKKYPTFPIAYINRGGGYHHTGKYALALDDFNKAIHIDPSHAVAYFNRAGLHTTNKRYDLAIADYTTALSFKAGFNDPRMAGQTYQNRGLVYAFQGRYDLAIRDYNQVLELDPDNALAYSNRGIAYYKQNRLEEALADFKTVLGLHPDDDFIDGFAHYMRERILTEIKP